MRLERFRGHPDPLAMISAFLHGVLAEAESRGYRFDRTKIMTSPMRGVVEESEGQLLFEWSHFLAKLERRAPILYEDHRSIAVPDPHPLFRIVPGAKRGWEK